MGDLTLLPYMYRTDDPGNRRAYREPAEMGRLAVPEERHDPDSRMIEIAFVRFPTTAAHPAPPLIYLAGGPGGAGTDSGRAGAEMFHFFMQAREIGDVILLDQRGTGLSHPALHSPYRWDLPLDQPGDRARYTEVALDRSRQTIAFWRERGVDLAGYTTAESADDIDAVRAALGAERMRLFGASYGSHLNLATIKRHTARVERAVIPLPEGPDHTNKLPANTQAQLERIAARVAADATLRAAIPDFLALIRDVLDRLAATAVTVATTDPETGEAVTVVIGKFDIQWWTARGLGSRAHIQALPARYHAMAQGDFAAVAPEIVAARCAWFGNAMSFQMDCASGATAARTAQIAREARETLLEDLIDFPIPDVCPAWGNPDLGDDFRAPVRAETPALFIAGTLDGRTPVANAEEVMAGFPNSSLIVIDGGTHSGADLVGPPAVNAAIIAFLRGEPVPPTTATIPCVFAPVA